MERLIEKLITWALVFSAMGEVGHVTRFFAEQAGEAHAHGLVSLSALNRSLESGGGHHGHRTRK